MSCLSQNYLRIMEIYKFLRSWSANGNIVAYENMHQFWMSLELYDDDDDDVNA